MSARVVAGLVPGGKPHPTTKWSLLMALLVVVVLGIPKIASAGQPTVQPPQGAQNGGVFTGTYSFETYIYCNNGTQFNRQYSNNLEGTHTFTFYGAPDGSLLVSIDSGGEMLVTSCGDPFTGTPTQVANYTVTKCSSCTPPPTPPPTSSPTPTPTPTPPPSGGGGTGGSSGSPTTTGSSGGVGATSPQTGTSDQSSAGDTPTPDNSTGDQSTSSPTASAPSPTIKSGTIPEFRSHPPVTVFNWIPIAVAGIIILLLYLLVWRVRPLNEVVMRRLRLSWLRVEPYWFRVKFGLIVRLPAFLKRTIKIHGRDQPKRRGLSARRHSGRLLAHHHTSYASLVFIILLTGVLTAAVSYSTRADSASSLLSLTVTGPPPSQAATIDSPSDGDHFTTSSVTVRGTCPSGVFVEIWRNGTFAGSTMCDINGLYSVLTTLTPGQNNLIARVADALGQYGPDSNVVIVYYDVPPPPTPTPTPSVTPAPAPSGATPETTPKPSASPAPPVSSPVITTGQHYYQGGQVDQPVSWTVTVTGGTAPYKLTWEWGDGSSDTTDLHAAGPATYQHQYSQPGIYQVTIRAADTAGREAVIQVVVVVSGPTPAISGNFGDHDTPGYLLFIWPMLVIMALIVLSFWLGERHKLSTLGPLLRRRAA